MRLVRVGGSYGGSREQRLWAALAGVVGLGAAGLALLVCDAGSGLCHPTVLRLALGFAAMGIALRLGRPVIRPLRRARSGRRGERLVADLLGGLPDDYWLVQHVHLGARPRPVRHLLARPVP